jgi:hypothetical protein
MPSRNRPGGPVCFWSWSPTGIDCEPSCLRVAASRSHLEGGRYLCSVQIPNWVKDMQNIVKGMTKAVVLGLFLCCVEQASAGASLSTTGSRGTVTPTGTMYGGFTLDTAGSVIIIVRGPSLKTLGATNNPLNNPSLRVYDAAGKDLLANTAGGVAVSACPLTQSASIYYAQNRGGALDVNDSCTGPLVLASGTYTFSITPSVANSSGEVLFEATFNSPLVSFSAQIQPIFTSNCIGCHVQGGIGPFDITAGKAYANLVPARVIAGNSAGSILYQRLTGVLTPSMPLGGARLADSDLLLIKTWIDQGAANN